MGFPGPLEGTSEFVLVSSHRFGHLVYSQCALLSGSFPGQGVSPLVAVHTRVAFHPSEAYGGVLPQAIESLNAVPNRFRAAFPVQEGLED